MTLKRFLMVVVLLQWVCGTSVSILRSAPQVDTAWQKHGTYVAQVYPIDRCAIAGTLRFVSQLPDGCMLVGSSLGAYLYDGSRWSPITGVTKAYCLVRGPSGRILIGSGGEVIEIKKSGNNVYEGHTLMKVNGVENLIEYIDEDPSGRVFGCYGHGFFFENDSGAASVVPVESWVNGFACIKAGNFLMVNHEGDHHLARVADDRSGTINIDERFKDELGDRHVIDVRSRNHDRCWVITEDGRTFSFDGTRMELAPWHKVRSDLKIVPQCLFEMEGGRILVGSVDRGLFIFSSTGELLSQIDVRNGLPEDTVVAATMDRDGGLWLATPKCSVRLDSKLRFTNFGADQGLKTQNCEIMTRHRGRLFVASEGGLFVQNPDAVSQADAFRRVPGVNTARAMVSDGETLWAGGGNLFALHGDGPLVSYKTSAVSSIVIPRRIPDTLVCGTSGGFEILRKVAGRWTITERIPTDGRMVYGMGEFRPDEFWGQLGTGKVARLRYKDGKWESRMFGHESGLPEDWIDLGMVDGVMVTPAEGWYHGLLWDDKRERFVPTDDYTFYLDNLGPHLYHPVYYRKDGTPLVRPNARDPHMVERISKVAFSAIQEAAGSREECAFGAFTDVDGAVWVCQAGGVVRCSGPLDDRIPTADTLVVRTVQDMRDGSLLAADLRNGSTLTLSPEHHWLHVTTALLEYRSEKYSMFRIWLEGFEPQSTNDPTRDGRLRRLLFTDWSRASQRDFTNLPSGDYKLHVDALDGMGMRRQQLVLNLKIQTPWYTGPLAKAAYGLSLLGGIVVLVRLRERALKQRNEALESNVHERTEELRDKNQSLWEGQRQIEEKHRELQRTLARTEELARDLSTANKNLQKTANEKTEFVRAISHELRNPLSGARMMSDMLYRAPLDERHHKHAADLRSCVLYLQTLLDETLDLTQLEAGHIAFKLEKFSANALLQDAASIFHPLAHEKKLELKVIGCARGEMMLFGDRTHTKRILINYLSNALKFTDSGSITLKVEVLFCSGGLSLLRFEVQDTGCGVSKAVQKRLFSRFIRGDHPHEKDGKPGAGLGLALCKQLAEIAGGTVGFTTKENEGSVFWAELPFIVIEEDPKASIDPHEGLPDFSDLSVFVLDDDHLQLEAMLTALSQLGVVPVLSSNVDEAMETLRRQAFDLVIIDFHLGEKTGIQILKELRTEPPPPTIEHSQFHLISALWDESLSEVALASGFVAAHKKPISTVSLFQILKGAREISKQ